MKSARIRFLAAVISSLAFAGAGVAEPYQIEPGDTLEFGVAGVPEFNTRVVVSADHTISIPVAGEISTRGMTLPALAQSVRQHLGSRVLNRRSSEGRQVPLIFNPDEISLRIAEYRPIYVDGDVTKPGQQSFRPGLTVRQAIALAGGLDVVRFRSQEPNKERADLKGEYDGEWTKFANQQALILRLKAELENKTKIDGAALEGTPIPQAASTRILELANQRLAARNQIFENEQAHLSAVAKTEADRVKALSEQQEKEKAGADSDLDELDRVQKLFEQKTVPITRVIEARRAILLSSTRYLQTVAQRGQSERDRLEFTSKLDRLRQSRRDALLSELAGAEATLAVSRSKLQALEQRMLLVNLVRSRLPKPRIEIFRRVGGEQKGFAGREDEELIPGDVVNVGMVNAPIDPGTDADAESGTSRSN